MSDSNTTVNENEARVSISASSSKISIIENNIQHDKNKILGVFYGIGMNVNLILGSGIVTTPGIIWNSVKSPAIVLLLWLIGGIVSMAGSLSYVELGVMHKISGGETKYLQTAYPNPKLLMSYLFSFMYIFAIRPGLISAVLQSAAQYFWYTIKGYRYNEYTEQDQIGWKLPFSPFWGIKLIAVGFLFIITLYHMLSVKWANYINQTLAVIKLITYSIIVIAGIYRLATDPSSRINWQQPLEGDSNIATYSTSILQIMFSYNGWNTLNYSLDEFRKPEKKLIYSNSISVAIVTFLYLFVNVAFISVVPGAEILNTSEKDETIAASFFRQLFNKSEATVRLFTGLIVLSVMGTAASGIWSGSRVIVASARSNYFPKYSKELRTWHEYFNTPFNALFVQFVWCSFIILFVGSSFTISSFALFSSFAMYSYWFFYTATGIGLLVIRRKSKDEHQNLFKVPLPIAGIFISAGLFILTFSFVVDDKCPGLDSNNCRIQKLAPIFISYGFLFLSLMVWYFFYYWWSEKRKAEEDLIMRIPADESSAYDQDNDDLKDF